MGGTLAAAQQPRDLGWPGRHGVEVVTFALDLRVCRVAAAASLVQQVTRHSGRNDGHQGQNLNRHGAWVGLD